MFGLNGAAEMNVLHTIHDWYDGPRAGAAEYAGETYWYRSIYLDTEEWNPDEDRFELTPLTHEALTWELERTSIFDRWVKARRDGLVAWTGDDKESFGSFPEDRLRYRQLNKMMNSYLAQNAPTLLVCGAFLGSRSVQWSLIRTMAGAE